MALEPEAQRGGVARIAARVILVLGAGFVVVGIGLLILFGTSSPGLGALLWGALLLVVYGFFEPDTVRAFLTQGTIQAGTRAALQAMLVIAAIILINVVVRDRLALAQVDLSKGGVNSLAPQTVTILKNLNQPLQATVWYGQNQSEMDTALKLLQQYHNVNSRFSVQEYSVFERPTLARQQTVQQADSVVFQLGTQTPQVTTDTSEQGLTTLLLRMSTGRSPKVYFITGHGEGTVSTAGINSYTTLKQALDKQAIQTAELNLAVGGAPPAVNPGGGLLATPSPSETPAAGVTPAPATIQIPSDADELIDLDPQTDLSPDELTALKGYLSKGGHMLIASSPFSKTNVNELLTATGVKFGGGVVLDRDMQYRQAAEAGVLLVETYGSSPVAQGLSTSPSILLGANPIEGTAATGYSLIPVVTSKANSCERTDVTIQAGDCQPTDKKGPFNLIATVEQTNAKVGSKPTRLVLMGSPQAVSDNLLSQLRPPGNVPLVTNAINWLAGQDRVINIAPRDTTPDTVFLSDVQRQLILYGYPFFIPVLIGVLGAVLYFRRRGN